jgi:peptidyl-prolyl cis-trans isomerase D
LSKETSAGFANVDNIRIELTQKVKNKLKGDYIIQKLQETNSTTLDEIAESYGNDANVYSNSELKLSSNSLPSIGFAPETIGKAFSLNDGEISSPTKENDGVVIIQVNLLIKAPEIADYTSYKNQLFRRKSGRTSYLTSETIKEYSNILDERYKYF